MGGTHALQLESLPIGQAVTREVTISDTLSAWCEHLDRIADLFYSVNPLTPALTTFKIAR